MLDLTEIPPILPLGLPQEFIPDYALDRQNIRVRALNARYLNHSAKDILKSVLEGAVSGSGQIALVSSFGAESVVLLHMAAMIDRSTPVLFIDTGMLFPETLAYQRQVAERLGLDNLTTVRASGAPSDAPGDIAAKDPDGKLHQRDTDACCHLRKTAPLLAALAPFDGWITGRKRVQSGTRAAMQFFEVEKGTNRIKVNPLAHWTSEQARAYMQDHDLPRHPLVARGYPSIGCLPCTTPVAAGEDPRAGRWRAQDKEECGIHFEDGKLVRRKA